MRPPCGPTSQTFCLPSSTGSLPGRIRASPGRLRLASPTAPEWLIPRLSSLALADHIEPPLVGCTWPHLPLLNGSPCLCPTRPQAGHRPGAALPRAPAVCAGHRVRHDHQHRAQGAGAQAGRSLGRWASRRLCGWVDRRMAAAARCLLAPNRLGGALVWRAGRLATIRRVKACRRRLASQQIAIKSAASHAAPRRPCCPCCLCCRPCCARLAGPMWRWRLSSQSALRPSPQIARLAPHRCGPQLPLLVPLGPAAASGWAFGYLLLPTAASCHSLLVPLPPLAASCLCLQQQLHQDHALLPTTHRCPAVAAGQALCKISVRLPARLLARLPRDGCSSSLPLLPPAASLPGGAAHRAVRGARPRQRRGLLPGGRLRLVPLHEDELPAGSADG